MKLYYSPTSPYARKARIVVIERGIADRVELVAVDPFDPEASMLVPNPLRKVPALLLDDGSALFDSPVVCAYLLRWRGERDGARAAAAADEWDVMRQHALGDGIIDAAFAMVMEARRPEAQRSAYWTARWRDSIARALAALEPGAARLADGFGIGAIAVACALAYLDFRLPDCAWRADHPGLAAWFARVSRRASMVATAPPR
jgi:glutathione S-transferase